MKLMKVIIITWILSFAISSFDFAQGGKVFGIFGPENA